MNGGDIVKNNSNKEIPFPFPGWDDGFMNDKFSYDPLGSYTGRTLERDETPVQDADDL